MYIKTAGRVKHGQSWHVSISSVSALSFTFSLILLFLSFISLTSSFVLSIFSLSLGNVQNDLQGLMCHIQEFKQTQACHYLQIWNQ